MKTPEFHRSAEPAGLFLRGECPFGNSAAAQNGLLTRADGERRIFQTHSDFEQTLRRRGNDVNLQKAFLSDFFALFSQQQKILFLAEKKLYLHQEFCY